MFKKISNILIVTILLISMVGFTINRHFCCNKLVSVTFGKTEDCCKYSNSCPHEKGQSCCHHQIKYIKILDSFQLSQDNQIIEALSTLVSFFETDNFLIHNFSFKTVLSYSDPPPLTLLIEDIFLQVFRN